MTTNYLTYLGLQENARANRAREEETQRHNERMEQLSAEQQAEQARNNRYNNLVSKGELAVSQERSAIEWARVGTNLMSLGSNTALGLGGLLVKAIG